MGVTEKQLKRYSARVRRQRRLRRLTLAALALLAVFLLVDRNFRPLVFSLAEARSAAMATRALNAALTEALEDGVDYDDLMNVRMDDGGQVSLLSANTMRMNALAERAGDAALRKLETVSAQKVDVPLGAALGLTRWQINRYVLIPQTLRRLIPQAINLATRMIKTTSLVMLIGVVEVLKISQQIIDASRYDAPQAAVFIYGVVFLMYFMVCWPISLLEGRLEKRWKE